MEERVVCGALGDHESERKCGREAGGKHQPEGVGCDRATGRTTERGWAGSTLNEKNERRVLGMPRHWYIPHGPPRSAQTQRGDYATVSPHS